jgi:hypothetical protein
MGTVRGWEPCLGKELHAHAGGPSGGAGLEIQRPDAMAPEVKLQREVLPLRHSLSLQPVITKVIGSPCSGAVSEAVS